VGRENKRFFGEGPLHQGLPGGNSCAEVVAAGQVRLRPGHLDGVMKGVTCEESPHSIGHEEQRAVSQGVPRSCLDSQAWRDLVRVGDDLSLTGFDYGPHALIEDVGIESVRVRIGVCSVPAPVLFIDEEVDRVREGRHPSPICFDGVPTAVIVVEMRAEHDVDHLRGCTYAGQSIQIWRVEIIEVRSSARPSIAGARVNQHGAAVDAQDPAVVGELKCSRRWIEEPVW